MNGFRTGFSLEFNGDRKVKRFSNNLKLTVGNKTVLWNRIMKEVKEERVAGPFDEPLFEFFIQSPIGLVPKDGGKQTRLIFHLSHPRAEPEFSVNGNIPKDKCTVKYNDFDAAILRCLEEGRNCALAKSDMKSAFRHLCLKVEDFCLLVFKAEDPETGEVKWFCDKTLPFRSSISCALFQEFSDCVAHLVKYRTKKVTVNYLDDYLFCSILKSFCSQQVSIFLAVCQEINFPVSMEKTVWAASAMIFLGLLINTVTQTVSIPTEKIEKAKDLLLSILAKKKVTVHELQKITGTLNFLCRAVVPGRAFARRLYTKFNSSMKKYHHIRITKDLRDDLQMWMKFLNHPSAYSRPFLDFRNVLSAEEIQFHSDASGRIGYGVICQNSWMMGLWDQQFLVKHKPSIEFLELFTVTAGVLQWIHRFSNQRVTLFCDNQAVCYMINKNSSSCKNCMNLIRLIVLESICQNVRIFAKYIHTKSNGMADSLSRGQLSRFYKLAPKMVDQFPTMILDKLWLLDKVWVTTPHMKISQ